MSGEVESRRSRPSSDPEAIVVGAGLGGLSAATLLAKNGVKVLLLERHNVPGGYATSFVRGRYEFEVALHELSGAGTPESPGPLYRYLDSLGMAERIEILQAPTLYRSVFPGVDLTLPSGHGRFEQVLCDAFPGDALGIRQLIEIIRQTGRDLAALRSAGMNGLLKVRSLLTLPFKHPVLFRYNQSTWDAVLRRYVRNPAARGVLSQLWGYFGLPPSECSFFYFGLALASYIKHGAAYIRGRSQALSNAFFAALEAHGGEARMGCGVARILVENGCAVGVVTEEGEEIRARWVVSNSDPVTTCRYLIGPEHIPAGFFRSLQPHQVATSTVNVYLGIARPAGELGLTDHEIFVNEDLDFDRHFRRSFTLEPPAAIAMTCYNHVFPEISPPGTSMVVLTALSAGRAWHGVRPEAYVETKHGIADSMIRLAERVAPGLRRFAEVIEVSTPVTNMRYASALGGSIYGSSPAPGRHTLWRIPHRGPVRGLFFVGAWTMPGGGFEPVMFSGELAAQAILQRIAHRKEAAR